jgi:hypothetical protein
MQTLGGARTETRVTQWAPVRLIVYVGGLAVTVVVATILTHLFVPPAPSPWHALVMLKNLLLPVALFALYAMLVRVLEHRRADEIDFRRAWPTFLAGSLIGSALISVTVLALWALGMAHISNGTGFEGLANAVLAPLVTAMGEELLFRVVLFGVLEQISGSLSAIVVSAALFGLSHAANPGAKPFVLATLSTEMGVMCALAYILSRNIWLAVGIHMGWNFTQGFVFGTLDSGLRDPHGFLHTTMTGPDLLTGGAFGLEGSIVTLGFSLVVCGVLYYLIRRGNNWRAPHFQLRPQVTGASARRE